MRHLPDTELEVMKALWAMGGEAVTRSDLEARLGEFQAQGWAEKTPEGRWRLTPRGFLVSNRLIGDLLERQEQASLSDLLPLARQQFRREESPQKGTD